MTERPPAYTENEPQQYVGYCHDCQWETQPDEQVGNITDLMAMHKVQNPGHRADIKLA
jgi:hypothetical protein